MEDSANHDNNQVNNQEIKPIEFEVLTPSDSVDVSKHKAALDQAFLDAKLRNIAITGPYGSGKSSILKSYLKCQEKGCQEKGQKYEDKCLWISLSQLHPTKDGNLAANNDQLQEGGGCKGKACFSGGAGFRRKRRNV